VWDNSSAPFKLIFTKKNNSCTFMSFNNLKIIEVSISFIILSAELSPKCIQSCYFKGVNPCLLKGQRTGVFVGCSGSEAEQVWCYAAPHETVYGLTGCVRAMFANQISYWLGITGKFF
jgi:hypothetical protein